MQSRRRNQLLSGALLILIVILSSSASAQDTKFGYGDVTVHLNGGDDVAYVGENNTIEFWIENDADLQAMSVAFEFSIGRNYQFNPNHGGTGKYVLELGRAVNAFFQGLQEVVYINDVTADSIHFGGAYAPPTYNGIPTGPSELCYTMEVYISPDQEELVNGFCIDNIFIPPVGEWLFMDNNGEYVPTFQGNPNSSETNPDAPQVCFDIVISNEPPAITNCPESPVMQSHSESYIYIFEAADPDPEDIMHWAIVDGPGSINEFTGEYTFEPADLGLVSVAVSVADDFGASDTCAFDIEVTNGAPTIANCPDQLYVGHCDVLYYQFEATDPDPGEPLAWTLNTAEGMIEPATGEFSFDASLYGLGSYTVEVVVSDGYEEDTCAFYIDVTNDPPAFLNDCEDEIGAVPNQVAMYDFDAVDPDPCDPITYAITSIFPQPEGDATIDSEGVLTFTPALEDIGLIFEFTISAADGYDETLCLVFIEVYEGDNCDNPIVVDSLPFTYMGSTEYFSDALEPLGCDVEDPLFGIGPDVVFSYMADELDTIYISVDPSTEWDAVLYILSECDPDSCIVWSNDGGDFWPEVIGYIVQAGKKIYIVIDGIAESLGPYLLYILTANDTLCKEIIRPEKLTKKMNTYDDDGVGRRIWSKNSPKQEPKDSCFCGYHQKSSTYIGRTAAVISRVKHMAKSGYAKIDVSFSGKYTVKPDPDYDTETGSVRCRLTENLLRVKMEAMNGLKGGIGKASFYYIRKIEPFYSNEIFVIPNSKKYVKEGSMNGAWLKPANKAITASANYGEAIGEVWKDVTFNKEYDINLTFNLYAYVKGVATGKVLFKEIWFKIFCPRKYPWPGKGEMTAESYPVEIEISDVVEENPCRQADITLLPDYAWSFVEVDSGEIDCGGIDFADTPLFNAQLFLANRINDYEYSDTLFPDSLAPSDTSALFILSETIVDPYSTSDILSAPSDICFDPYGQFGNLLYVVQIDEFDYDGFPLSGSGSIVTIDDQGLLDTLINGLNLPVGLIFTSGPPFGDNMYVAELDLGEIIKIDSSGIMTSFASGLKCPLDLTVGSGSFGDYLYIAEYDTNYVDSISTPLSGRIVKVNPSGDFTVFVDGLQPAADLAFGPGGVFGTDLYVALDNEMDDSLVYLPNTGKIVVIDSAGNITDLATGLNYPNYIAFDPSGVMYVSAQGGIIKIAPYVCGDANSDWVVNVSDAVYIINYVFVGGDPPSPLEAGDTNCDGTCNISDAVWIINYVFVGGKEPCDTNGDSIPDC